MLGQKTVELATRRPRTVTAAMLILAALLILLVALPLLAPGAFSMLHTVTVDTDPENMLGEDEPVRVFHNQMKEALSLYDMIVVGVVNDTHPQGVFNPESLRRVYEFTAYAATLRGEAIGEDDPRAGVVERDIIAPSTVDNIEQGGLGEVRFEWLMRRPPETDAEALQVRDKALRLPFQKGTLVSEDGKALALYLPITAKDLSHKIYKRLLEKIAGFDGNDQFHITGLPVAEDTFGVEMLIQMGISAPMAMFLIFLLLLAFFRKLTLILSPLIVALVSVIYTMTLLIITGNTIHIMSSMIPILIMPIAVLDSVHILSEFFDRYPGIKDRRKTILAVVDTLFVPMLYTSLTSAAGFASLALTPIPPVQVFGIFVAIGIMAAWLLTIVFIPAYVMLIPEATFTKFGRAAHSDTAEHDAPTGWLGWVSRFTFNQGKLILALTALIVIVAGYGISQIQINDNPMKWFKKSHPIRVADRVLNSHFGGTYMAYLALSAPEDSATPSEYAKGLTERLNALAKDVPEAELVLPALLAEVENQAGTAVDTEVLLSGLADFVETKLDDAEGDRYFAWEEIAYLLDDEAQRGQLFKQPEVLRYIEALQAHLLTTGIVGKSNSLADVVKTVHRELLEGAPEQFRIPDTAKAVAQCLITFEGGHRPHDLYHFVTPDYRQSSLWVQLKSGDNKDMAAVVASVDAFMAENPPPLGIERNWFGLTYINVIWQEKMVSGMLKAFLGSFIVVLLMMTVLFRSALWGLLAMIPLTVTIAAIYGVIGLIGKDYDMPVAVLSSLTLGLAVDFAIHFMARAKALYTESGSWQLVHQKIFGEPARAITRNIIVIALGFTPLLAAPLVPYNTVGIFLAAILFFSGGATLFVLPVLMRYLKPQLFSKIHADENNAPRA